MVWHAWRSVNRRRVVYAALLPVVIAVGLTARAHRPGADAGTVGGFLATFTGDTLWAVMFFLIGRVIWPRRPAWQLAVGVLALTLTIEFSQLWHAPLLEWLRSYRVTGFMLGYTFLWADVLCLLVGTGLALGLDAVVRAFVTDQRETVA